MEPDLHSGIMGVQLPHRPSSAHGLKEGPLIIDMRPSFVLQRSMKLPYTPDWDHVSTANGYRVVRCVGHPKAWKKGSYVYVHVVVAEQKLGRLLRDDELAHHDDENKFNNSPENIVVTSRPEHTRLHHKPAIVLTMICAACGKKFQRERRRIRDDTKPVFCSKQCAGVREEFEHGTASAYSYRKCRCDLCRAGHTERQKKYRKRP